MARTQRLVESAQTMIRIVGLSATLPNYLDAADFLKVGFYKHYFHSYMLFSFESESDVIFNLYAIQPNYLDSADLLKTGDSV